MRTDVMGVGFDNVTMTEALTKARALLEGKEKFYCVTPNPEIVYETMHNARFCEMINGASMVLPDGIGIILGAKILGTPLKEKVTGVDFAQRLLAVLAEESYTLYLLGSKPGVAELAAEKMREMQPELNICGIADGYFKDENAVVAAINEANPDVLFVCLGSPKQEHFMTSHLDELNCKMQIGLGGSLDAFAGTVKRAPAWMSRVGLEWFYRLIKEPRRFKRMLRLPKFLFAVIGRRIKGR